MNIKEFVKSTISQISEAVAELNEELTDKNVTVNPINAIGNKNEISRSGGVAVSEIYFDLSVSVSDTSGMEGKIGILSSVIGLGAAAKEGSQNALESKVRFTIPVALPHKKH